MAYTDIDKPSDYFNTLTYTGDGVSPKSITGVGFQPDFVWLKNRGTTNYYLLQDVIRGVTSTNVLSSNDSTAEPSFTNIGFISSFNSDGFTATSSGGSLAVLNASANNYVAWNWKANGAGVSNTAGDITSTVSASTTSGFSIVSYTGSGTDSDTVGHGLGSAPKMIILKRRDALDNWYVMHTSLSTNNSLNLDTTNAQRSTSILTYGVLSTSPTSSTFSFVAGGGAVPTGNVNNSGSTYIAYCFADVKGFSKFGSYTGNGSADGPFVYTGFSPAFVMVKRTNTTSDWAIWDTARNTYNVVGDYLLPNTSGAEGNVSYIDVLSNGFKIRSSSVFNTTNDSIIYMAFAENPFVTSTSIPTTAR
jgi:hypothetical protein